MNQLNDNGSLIHGLSLNSKGKLIWTDSLDSLRAFVEEALNLTDGKWSSPGGDTKMYENQGVAIKWHMKTQTLAVHEDENSLIEEKLMSMALISKKLASNLVNNDSDQNVHVDETTNCPSPQINSSRSLEILSTQLEALSKDVNANTAAIKLFTEHANAYNTEMDNLKIENLKLMNENSDLKNENDNLKERVNNLSYILADLQGKAKNANEEKDSLVIAMRLLVEDLNNKGNTTNLNHDEETEQSSPPIINDIQQTNNPIKVSQTVINPRINLSNSFSALSVDKNDESDRDAVGSEAENKYATTQRSTQTIGKIITQSPEEVSETEQRVTKCTQATSNQLSQKPQREQNRTIRKNNTQRHPEAKRNTVIVGDSIIKYVKGWEISNSSERVTVKSFSGATVDDMKDFIRPILRKKPEKLILHIGTNDLRNTDPKAVADSVSNLVKSINQQRPDTKVIVSGILTRKDVNGIADAVRQTNSIIESLCRVNGWVFIANSNIKDSHLNSRGLHLNPSGSLLLQNNFKLSLRT